MTKPTICDEHGEREMTDEEYAIYLIVTEPPAPSLEAPTTPE
jgi:hypothetical protein